MLLQINKAINQCNLLNTTTTLLHKRAGRVQSTTSPALSMREGRCRWPPTYAKDSTNSSRRDLEPGMVTFRSTCPILHRALLRELLSSVLWDKTPRAILSSERAKFHQAERNTSETRANMVCVQNVSINPRLSPLSTQRRCRQWLLHSGV